MGRNLPKLHGVGLRSIAELLSYFIPPGEILKDLSTTKDPFTEPPTIVLLDKETEAASHKAWACAWDSIHLYTDGSKLANGSTASPRHCVRGPQQEGLFEGSCCPGRYANNEDREIHAIQEGLQRQAGGKTGPRK